MLPRERVLTVLMHREADRVPLFYRDVPEVRRRLLRDLRLADDQALLRHLDIDFRWVEPAYVGPTSAEPQRETIRNIWGVEQVYVQVGATGGYWQDIAHPLADCHDAEALKDYPWPQLAWFDFTAIGEQVARYGDYALMTAAGHASQGILTPLQHLLGMERAWTVMLLEPEFYHELMRHIMGFLIPYIEAMLTAAAGRLDFVRLGDDYGTQRGLLLSPEQWREYLRPYLEQIADVVHSHDSRLYQHSCGGIRELIPDLIAAGVDVLDPVQVLAAGMEPAALKRDFGHQLCFSGGVDEQELLSRGSPEQVRAGVFDLLDKMARQGGFILGPTHNLQDDISTENIVAMYDAAREWSYAVCF